MNYKITYFGCDKSWPWELEKLDTANSIRIDVDEKIPQEFINKVYSLVIGIGSLDQPDQYSLAVYKGNLFKMMSIVGQIEGIMSMFYRDMHRIL